MSSTFIELAKEIQIQCDDNKQELQEDMQSLCQDIYNNKKKLLDLEIELNSLTYRLKKLEDRPTFNSKPGSFGILPLIKKY